MLQKPKEYEIQIAVMEWVEYKKHLYPHLNRIIHIPNEGMAGGQKRGRILKAMGLRAGVPDLFLPVSNGIFKGLWIELKRDEKSKVSIEQDDWITYLAMAGYAAIVTRGYDETIKAIENYYKPITDGTTPYRY